MPGARRWRKIALALTRRRDRAHFRAISTSAITDFTTRRAISSDALPYTEPPYWHQPVSHISGRRTAAGAAPAEAEAVYRDSLMNYRLDGWALYGLAQALDAQGKHDEAKTVRAEFAKVWSTADVKLASSRF